MIGGKIPFFTRMMSKLSIIVTLITSVITHDKDITKLRFQAFHCHSKKITRFPEANSTIFNLINRHLGATKKIFDSV